MKTASFPSLRVAPELRQAAEEVLAPGESLSSFVETSIRQGISQRTLQKEFVARGLAARDEARRTGEYFAADLVHEELEKMLVEAESRTGS